MDSLGSPLSTKTVRHGLHDLLTVGRWRHSDAECETAGGDVLAVVIDLSESQRVERRVGRTWTQAPTAIGAITIADPQVTTSFAIRGPADVLQLFLPIAVVAEVAKSFGTPAVQARFHAFDPEIERCALRALVAVRDGEAADDLLMASIAYRLAARVAERARTEMSSRAGGVSPTALRRVEALIAEHLDAATIVAPSLSDLAGAAGLSPHHFARAFRQSVGETPYAHVLRRRLELARRLLAHHTPSVAEVGHRAGFASTSHFVASFRQSMGVTPGAFRDALLT